MTQILFLLHGMGSHPTDEGETPGWDKEIKDVLQQQMLRYSNLKDKKLEDYVKVVPLNYDEVFEGLRESWRNQSEAVESAMTDGFADIKLIQFINSLQAGFSNDNFFNTHVLDVLLYRFTLLGEKVRIKLALEITKKLSEANLEAGKTVRWHILAHSLGTKVLHDTMHKLFSEQDWLKREGHLDYNYFSKGVYTPKSITLLANVSRVLQDDGLLAYKSKFRPGTGGVCRKMINLSHKFDPFAQLLEFDPTSDRWPVQAVQGFKKIDISLITEKNVHAFSHYLLHPQCHVPIFKQLFGPYSIKKDEIDKELTVHKELSNDFVSGPLEKKLAALQLKELKGFPDFFRRLEQYSDLIS